MPATAAATRAPPSAEAPPMSSVIPSSFVGPDDEREARENGEAYMRMGRGP